MSRGSRQYRGSALRLLCGDVALIRAQSSRHKLESALGSFAVGPRLEHHVFCIIKGELAQLAVVIWILHLARRAQ